tara:strand:- start:124 stop:567 length:444 start_codon:yes stop_codon:yes gene_type:complete
MSFQDNHEGAMPLKMVDFTGCLWVISRYIIDHTEDAKLIFTGRCEVSDAWYQENGQMVLPDGQALSSTRRYRWDATLEGVDVHFDDGRFFHRIDLAHTATQDRHFCDPDDYAVSYVFTEWPIWTSLWKVKGPRKDYEMHSRYQKLAL